MNIMLKPRSVMIILASVFATITHVQANTLPEQCQKLFKETENLIAEAEKQPGTHVQLAKIKSKLKQSKQQILAMEHDIQIKSCDIGLAKLHTK
ncbi:hypothetical protein FWK45_01390 [Histophilus somni]|uniref:Recombinase XerD n=2 Tax=Histophilus somni TaxID=731 RepID=A0AAX2S0H6_HISSO|nr:hypothetical protein FWK43_08420 [Histophilus somni]QEH11855.1 hypothetical protein FWK44_01395 [Histophilus somni]QEH18568.1 hypothetical protein FWK48_08440 [Histophilus somni]QEH25764.1 hypothetical protein FWK61_08415 [Histophilus somni]QEH26338.1 hypothetical protein FWK62_01410 [Histophilus somni]